MAYKTPEQIRSFFDKTMHRMDTPQQWYGTEPNSYMRDWDSASVRTCIFACWAYEQAAGNQSIPLVYRTINEHREDFLADRCYFPSTPRDLRLMEKGGIPIHGIESKRQLADFDVIGTSVSYPVLSVNFVKQLLMSDIPPTWEDRHEWGSGKDVAGRHRNPEKWPFVIVGGQGYGAPEVLANIADAVFCGEVEDEPTQAGFGAVLDRVDDFKRSGRWSTDRVSCYADLAREFEFLYFPMFVEVLYAYEDREEKIAEVIAARKRKLANLKKNFDYDTLQAELDPDRIREEVEPSRQVVGYRAKIEGMRLPVVKRFVKDMNAVKGLENPPLLYIDPGMGAGDLETQRGCPAWCSFCALTYRQKPYRQRGVDEMVEFGKELTRNTGGVHLAPFGPDFPMHSQKKKLISALLENVTDDIDASSMRVDDFIADPSYILLQAHGGMDSVTLGVEGNSQRMRDLVGKGAADEDVKEAVARGIAAGIRKFKLYMIAALPGEEDADIVRCLNLAKDLADIRDSMGSNARIQFSWTPMLIEGNTPFQWFRPTSASMVQGDVWERFKELNIDFKLGGKAQHDKITYFQLTQRASREIGRVMVETVAEADRGCWGGAPRGLADRIEENLVAAGFHNGIADAYDEREKADLFGWEMIDQGINVELMWVTYQQMKEFLEFTDADSYDEMFADDYHGNEWLERCDTKCYGKTCGVCDAFDLKERRDYIQGAAEEVTVDLNNVKVIDQRTQAMRVRFRVFKSEDKRFVMNDHWRYAVRRAAYRAEVPIAKRTIKFSSDALKFKDWTSGADFMEFALTVRVDKKRVAEYVEVLGRELGEDLVVTDWTLLPAKGATLRADVDLSLFEIELDVSAGRARTALREWEAAEYVPLTIKEEQYGAGEVRTEFNAKELVPDIWLVRDGHRLVARMMVRGKANPYHVYAALFGKRSWLEAADRPAVRLEAFVESDSSQYDFFRPSCDECAFEIPVNLLDKPFDPMHCPRCRDEVTPESGFVDGIARREVVAT